MGGWLKAVDKFVKRPIPFRAVLVRLLDKLKFFLSVKDDLEPLRMLAHDLSQGFWVSLFNLLLELL